MNHDDSLARQFEQQRPRLRSVAYRMLGSLSEAEDAVQEAWFRLSRADASRVDNLAGWLTTVVGRVCLDQLRSRAARREEPLETHVPDPVIGRVDAADPEQAALLADSVGLAMMVVLDTLPPAERLAFVLHDMFAVPFDDLAPIVDRTPAATRQLASRARRRVRGAATPEADLTRQRVVLDAFLAASRTGDFEALVTLLDPDITLRADVGATRFGALPLLVHGAAAVAQQALLFRGLAPLARPVLVNGALGLVTAPDGRLFSILALTVVDGRITEINLLADPDRLRTLPVPPL
ncbi:RNA polymerase sigma factor SigJ [Streptomyces sp. CB01881]|uniref:RNA polymerase sigma factor SigJ n=1 Tax=Streptomyces sp. CB01881 TaxID=2078691 RepID=UPI000CDC3F06|nr:RNA polymerase sigma factor SigJ [Streptomyces sp. CB01881]AUY50849.1 RNA polymerase subunit sigma-70 [Streptomyces sp. CB01881]TYC74232.1 sigma-70 family RNA polymerase sigma factor [Streptomyces sp. CB01881]